MSSRLFCSFIQGVFATVFDPSQKKKRKKSKFDPQGDYLVSGKHITRRGGCMVNVLDSESSVLGSSLGHGHCVVIYNKTRWGVTLLWTSIPSREVQILVVNESPVNTAETGIRTRLRDLLP